MSSQVGQGGLVTEKIKIHQDPLAVYRQWSVIGSFPAGKTGPVSACPSGETNSIMQVRGQF